MTLRDLPPFIFFVSFHQRPIAIIRVRVGLHTIFAYNSSKKHLHQAWISLSSLEWWRLLALYKCTIQINSGNQYIIPFNADPRAKNRVKFMSANNVPSKLPQICSEATVVAHQCILCREKYVHNFVINLIAFADVYRSYSCRIPVHPPGRTCTNSWSI
jgi:hypothetical protein